MAFGIKREELKRWKRQVQNGEIAFLTHYWLDERFPDCNTVTKVGCSDIDKLKDWGRNHGLSEEWIDYKADYPHFDLFGKYQRDILIKEEVWDQMERFSI